MKAHVFRYVTFFSGAGLGLVGFLSLPSPLGWIVFAVGTLAGGIASMLVFKRFATENQRKAALEARLHND